MSFDAIFDEMLEESEDGVGNGYANANDIDLSHLFRFPKRGDDKKSVYWVDVKFMAYKDEMFFKGGVAKVYQHGYFDNRENKGVTYDCMRNYGLDCPICTMQRLDYKKELADNGKDKDRVTPFVAKSWSQDKTFMWMYIVDACEKLKESIGQVKLFAVPTAVSNLIKNVADPEFCKERNLKVANVVSMKAGAIVRLQMDCSVTENNKLYDTSHVLQDSINKPFVAKADGTIDIEGTKEIFAKITPNPLNTAKFFGWRVSGNENTPESLAHAYNSYSEKNTQYRYKHTHPLLNDANADASSIQGADNNGTQYNNFGQNVAESAPAQQPTQTQATSAPQPLNTNVSGVSFDDFDDDIPF